MLVIIMIIGLVGFFVFLYMELLLCLLFPENCNNFLVLKYI